jgi:magnesium chelatase accessory protein
MHWETDGRDWPHRRASRFVDAAGLRWHLQPWALIDIQEKARP